MYHAIRIDFMSDEKCIFCNSGRDLKRGVVLRSNSNETLFSSSHCLKKHQEKISNYYEKIPDLTKGIIRETNASTHNNNLNNNKKTDISEEEREENERIKNIEYLLLRQEKLPQYLPHVKYENINYLNESYRKNFFLTQPEQEQLKKFCNFTESKFPHYSYKTLKMLYAGFFWLEYAIEHTKNLQSKKFLESIFNSYKEYSKLTEKQITTVQNILKNLNSKINNEKQKIPSVTFQLHNPNPPSSSSLTQ